MRVTQIIANLPAPDPADLAAFYRKVFDLTVEHDMGWIAFMRAPSDMPVRLQLASEGGSGTDLPVISIGVDDLEEALAKARAAGIEPAYGPVDEPWGVRRFYLRDPAGNLVNVVTHS
jgi:predicted enzyme related to lactoylglutathione lyase